MNNIDIALARLNRFDPTKDSLDELEDIADGLAGANEANIVLNSVMEFIERNPSADLGAPGPLVHLVERFFRRGYERELEASVLRSPTPLTLWMLNRVINGTEGDERRHFLDVMLRLATEAPTAELRGLAEDFVSEEVPD